MAIETKVDSMQSDITEIKDSLREHINREENNYYRLKKEFAAKWSEKAVYAIILAIVGIALQVLFSK